MLRDMKQRVFLLALLAGAMAAPAGAETAAAFLSGRFRDCNQFVEKIGTAQIEDLPDLFTCHRYAFRGPFLVGYIRFRGATTFSMVLKTDKHGQCDGSGKMGWSGRNLSASGRFRCGDGALGGLAFEAERQGRGGAEILIGTIYGGIDGHESRINEEDREDADFWVYDQAAVRDFLKTRQ